MKTAHLVVAAVALCLAAPLRLAAEDIGILKGRYGCPAGAPEVGIFMDNEDTNQSSALHGWVGATQLDSNGNVTYRFCRVPSDLLVNAPGEFAVLSLDSRCPAGTQRFTRFFDSENRNNKNRAIPSDAAIAPNDAHAGNGENALLFFCRSSGGTGTFPDLGVEYGVFANASAQPNALQWGDVFNDDENTWPGANSNYYVSETSGRSRYSPYPRLVDGSQNTSLYMARVTSMPVPTRPVARCNVSPTQGDGFADAAFQDGGSYARNGRALVDYRWSFSDGSPDEYGLGPHYRRFWSESGGPETYSGTLTVTDSAGETASATCYVSVTSCAAGAAASRVPPICLQ